jgi:hypothetical protein
MNQLFTIVYYTSNREELSFEKKIMDNLLKVCGDIPIISVSQKPMDFGYNICVGDVGIHNANLYRQIQIGCKEADTPFVISAEADCLYPPDYFQYVPPAINECYKCTNNYILNQWGKGEFKGFYKKEVGLFAMITGREHFIREIDHVLKDRPVWSTRRDSKPVELFKRHRWKLFDINNPVVSLKTFNGMRKHTRIIEPPVEDIPYWGNCDKLRKEMWDYV